MINEGILGRTYKRNSVFLLLILVIIAVMLKNPNIFRWVETSIWKYYIFPFIWVSILGIIVFIMSKIHPMIPIRKQEYIYIDAMVYAFILLAVQYLAGILIYKVGKTPYDLSLRGIWSNFLSVILPFIVIDFIRSYFINSFCRKKNIALFLFISLIITIIDINIHKIASLVTLKDITIYLAEQLGPSFVKNIVLTYLAFYGGPIAAICYGGLLLAFHWFCPILPELNWLAQGVIGIVVPIMFIMLIINKYDKQYISKRRQAKMDMKENLSWAFTLALSVVIIWFVVGVFPIFPSVIVTGSMEPLIYPGDVILVKQFYSEEEIKALQIGDIIYFQRDDIVITHRIKDIIFEENGKYSFLTKGDNNSVEDVRLVRPEEVKGKYMLAIPKIGYPTLWLKSSQLEERNDVEN